MWISIGAFLAALAVAAGAFGAHGLAGRFDARALELWETASRYLMYGGLATVLAAVARKAGVLQSEGAASVAVASLAAGASIFSGTLFLMALGGPRWLGAVTPIGGLLMIVGLVALAFAA
jgi:uncharacterized membrane protein YgdD (TMEM256/DUF423 family)